ncbi:MAG: efflux RND transporter periplasmic adaptor subunit [Candidatus Moranbacteria bacterium]|nr:efflux RND transporter periplasmic adaptor subunit [Candidatus Moranbacteria bacterium]
MKDIFRKAWVAVWRHKIVMTFVILALAGAGYYFGYYEPSQSKAATATQVKTATAKREDLRVSVTGSGQVYARNEVSLKPVAAGDAIEILSVSVKNDQDVKEGDLIAVLDTGDAVKAVRDATLSLRSAEIKMKQTEDLYDKETKDDKLNRQSQEIAVAQARNKLADAREELEDYNIRAPFDGVVTSLSVSAGDSVSRDDAVASVISKELYAKISLNEVDAAGVKTGDTVTLTFDAIDGKTVEGAVSKIDTIGTVSQNVVTYNAELTFDSLSVEDLKPGMSVDVEIVTEEKTGAVTVPIAAVKTDRSGASFVVVRSDDGSDRRVTVETGLSTDTSVEITKGILEGQEVVIRTEMSSASVSSSEKQSGSVMMMGGTGMGGGRPPGM